MNKLLIATNNKGKEKELQELLKDTGLDVVTPAQINLQLDVVEDGNTYAENATKKAVAFANASEAISPDNPINQRTTVNIFLKFNFFIFKVRSSESSLFHFF